MELEALTAGLLEEARRYFREALDSFWWKVPVRKGIFLDKGEAMEGPLKKWLVRTAGTLGLRKYKVVSFNDGSQAGAMVLARGPGGYRILYVNTPDIVMLKLDGKKHVVPLSMALYYGAIPKKYSTPVDLLLPRYKRTIASAGYWMEAVKGRPGILSGEEDGGWHIRGTEGAHYAYIGGSVRVSKAPLEAAGLPEFRRATGIIVAHFDYAARCYSSITSFIDYKARYVLLIPPLIFWKWGHVVYPDTILEKKESREACPR